jgi:hypothetical protein
MNKVIVLSRWRVKMQKDICTFEDFWLATVFHCVTQTGPNCTKIDQNWCIMKLH